MEKIVLLSRQLAKLYLAQIFFLNFITTQFIVSGSYVISWFTSNWFCNYYGIITAQNWAFFCVTRMFWAYLLPKWLRCSCNYFWAWLKVIFLQCNDTARVSRNPNRHPIVKVTTAMLIYIGPIFRFLFLKLS